LSFKAEIEKEKRNKKKKCQSIENRMSIPMRNQNKPRQKWILYFKREEKRKERRGGTQKS